MRPPSISTCEQKKSANSVLQGRDGEINKTGPEWASKSEALGVCARHLNTRTHTLHQTHISNAPPSCGSADKAFLLPKSLSEDLIALLLLLPSNQRSNNGNSGRSSKKAPSRNSFPCSRLIAPIRKANKIHPPRSKKKLQLSSQKLDSVRGPPMI